jgi:phosphatidate cytidylyltransferase
MAMSSDSWVKKSKLGTRVLVAVVLGPVVLGSAYIGRLPFVAVVSIIVLAALVEYYALTRRQGARPFEAVGILTSLGIIWGCYRTDWALVGGSLAVLVGLATLAQVFRGPEGSIEHLATTVFGPAYVSLLFSHLLLVRELPLRVGLPYRNAGLWIVGLILVVWICDTGAFFVGASFGRRKLAPTVSPNKTWEGAIAGFVCGELAALALRPLFFPALGVREALCIGAIVGVLGQASDLTESLLKRDVGVKDSSQLIPGHGGMLDRFDSFFLAAPGFYWFLRIVVFR